MLRPRLSLRAGGLKKRASKKARRGNSFERTMRTLLLQNQQMIIQQQNMIFMVIKQLQPSTNANVVAQSQQQQPSPQSPQVERMQQITTPELHQHNPQQQPQHHEPQSHHLNQTSSHQHRSQQQQQPHMYSSHEAGTATINMEAQQMQQAVDAQLTGSLSHYLTPAASEQDPISDNKHEDEDLAALLEGDGLLSNNLLYNPQTDIGPVTPYKSHHHQQQTPSYYSSGCESLTTPKVDQQRQQTVSISQNVVKNLADSFKSPTKPKINVQILSGSATRNLKNSKAKIIQRMNISEFLRHVHQDEPQKSST